jgi:hypothetical protein
LEKESAEGILYLNSILDDNKFNEYWPFSIKCKQYLSQGSFKNIIL